MSVYCPWLFSIDITSRYQSSKNGKMVEEGEVRWGVCGKGKHDCVLFVLRSVNCPEQCFIDITSTYQRISGGRMRGEVGHVW